MSRPATSLLLALLIALSGCGFHPLYGSQERAAEAQLPDIFVATIPGRNGQLLRQALQQRLAGSSSVQPQGYTLQVGYAFSNESLAIHNDSTSARNRLIGRANWTLASVAQNPVLLTSGIAQSVDGYNDVDTQYFAATLASESTGERIAGNLADSIAIQLAVWFETHPQGSTGIAASGSTTAPPPPAVTPPAMPAAGYLAPQGIPDDSGQTTLQPVGPDGLPPSAIGR